MQTGGNFYFYPDFVNELRINHAAMLIKCTAGRVYIMVFPDRKAYKKFIDQLAWETEVWIADNPNHMIHLNEDRFIGPR